MVLRPLMWFDTLDLKDPTGQTAGVGALRLKWYPWPNLALWGWVVRPDYREYASPGGRIEYTLGAAEFGLTYHHNRHDPLNTSPPDFVSSPLLPYASKEDRLALDTRLDWKIGLWSEVLVTQATVYSWDGGDNHLQKVMVGGDYTLPWGDGVYVMVEHLWSRLEYYRRYVNGPAAAVISRVLREEHLTLLMVSVPWAFFDNLMGFWQYDWENDRLYNFLMWQRTYDNFSLNTILYANPKREVYQPEFSVLLPESLMGFGNGIQFMIVYNH